MRIRAAVSREVDAPPRIEALQLAAPRADEVLVRVVAAGICHTDLRAHAGGGLPVPRPVVLGHEGAGVIEQVGSAVQHLRPGDRVVLSGSSCGGCPSCRANLPSYCDEVLPRSFGGQRVDGSSALSGPEGRINGHFFGQSSFATHCLADARGAVRIGDDIPLHVAAPLACGVITGAGAVLHVFGLRPGASLVVIGAGSVGLSAVMAARLSGASRIITVDPLPQRRELSLALGATETLDARAEDIAEQVRQIVPRGADFALNTTAVPAAYEAAMQVLAVRGMAAFVTSPADPVAVRLQTLQFGGRSLRGIIGGDAAPQLTIPLLLDHWQQGRFPMDRLITRFKFDDIEQAFAAAKAGQVVKPVLLMEEA
jgi:aryl-alcohol dehydrogenase